MSPRAKKSQSIGDAAEVVLRRIDKTGKRHNARVVGVWSGVVGPDIARHTKGFAFRENRELVVFVDTAAWANELSLMASDLTERINTHIGEDVVRSLRFTVSRVVSVERAWEETIASADETYEPEPIEPEALSEIEVAQAQHVAAAIEDGELREIALRVMMKDLALKKGTRGKKV